MTGCDLILRGKNVPKVMENGQWGYKVVKRPDAVIVNGIVFVDKRYELPEMVNIDPEIQHEVAVREMALDWLRNTMEFRGKALVAVSGERLSNRHLPRRFRMKSGLDSSYHSLLSHLQPGYLVIRSGALTKYFPLDRADEVRASLARIPGREELLYVDSYGEPYYERIQDGDFVWPSSIIADVVDAAKEGGR